MLAKSHASRFVKRARNSRHTRGEKTSDVFSRAAPFALSEPANPGESKRPAGSRRNRRPEPAAGSRNRNRRPEPVTGTGTGHRQPAAGSRQPEPAAGAESGAGETLA